MSFRYFLILLEAGESPSAAYERIWKSRFEKLEPHRKKHFSQWFPEGQDRIYLPIKIKDKDFQGQIARENEHIRKKVQKVFNTSGMFKILDWKAGLAIDNSKNTWKIAKALLYLSNDKETREKHDAELEKRKFKLDSDTIEGIRDDYLRLPMKFNKTNNLMVVISQDVHDIARMSTGRRWGSCMSLPLGQAAEKKYGRGFKELGKEVLQGGLIAYLVEPNDYEVKNPYSRVLMRRYENPVSGESILVCSDKSNEIYGALTDKLTNFLIKWISKRQKPKSFGTYHKKGGRWITGDPYTVEAPIPKITRRNEGKIIQHLKEAERLGQDRHDLIKGIFYQIADQGYDTISKKFWKNFKKIMFDYGTMDDYLEQKIGKFWKENPDAIEFQDIIKLERRDAENILANTGERTSNFYRGAKSEMEKNFPVFVKSMLDKALKKSYNKINLKEFSNVLKNIDGYELTEDDIGLVQKIFNKAKNIISKGKQDKEDKKEFLENLMSIIRYSFINYKTKDMPRLYETIAKNAMDIAIKGLDIVDRYDLRDIVKIYKDMDWKVPSQVLGKFNEI